jgi:hypothetical protein
LRVLFCADLRGTEKIITKNERKKNKGASFEGSVWTVLRGTEKVYKKKLKKLEKKIKKTKGASFEGVGQDRPAGALSNLNSVGASRKHV